jgi:hypothetical protein
MAPLSNQLWRKTREGGREKNKGEEEKRLEAFCIRL